MCDTCPHLQTLNFDHYPMSITNEYESSLNMDVEVTFANTFSSFSICIHIVFEGKYSYAIVS